MSYLPFTEEEREVMQEEFNGRGCVPALLSCFAFWAIFAAFVLSYVAASRNNAPIVERDQYGRKVVTYP